MTDRFVLIKNGDVVYDSGDLGVPVVPTPTPTPTPTPAPVSGDWPPARLPFAFSGPGQSSSRSFTVPHVLNMEFGVSCPPGDVHLAFDGVLTEGAPLYNIAPGPHTVTVTSSQGTEGRGTSGSIDFYPG